MSEKKPKTPPEKSPPPNVRLVPSELFFTATATLPGHPRHRERESRVEELLEANSPLPLDQDAWGYLWERKGKESRLFYYATTRDLVFQKAEEANDPSKLSVLPAFAATAGLSFKKPTWIFLTDEEGLAAIRFEPGWTLPAKVVGRFHEAGQDPATAFWKAREELLAKWIEPEPGDEISPGVLRATPVAASKPGTVAFALEQRASPESEWALWKKTELRQKSQLLAADIRDHGSLEYEEETTRAGRRIAQVLITVLACVFLFSVLEFILWRKSSETRDLREKIERQAPAVKELQEIEAMKKSLDAVFEKNFQPFLWIMALNDSRPAEVAFTSFALEQENQVIVNGRATEVRFINTFTEELETDDRFASIRLGDIQTAREGTTFSLSAVTGDWRERPAPPEPPDGTGAESETEEEVENAAEEAPPAATDPNPAEEPAAAQEEEA